jgi:hypothetical protein
VLSHYENRLIEGFDFIIFALNNRASQDLLLTTLRAFFLPEYQKSAIVGDTFGDAVTIKIDDENNTAVTRAAGDLNAEISVAIVDTVERFIMRVGQAGLFESAEAA